MLQGSLEPNVFTFGSAFQVCQHGNGLKALELYQDFRDLHVESGIISCNQVMAACSSSQLWEESLELMAGARREALESTVVTVSSAVKNDLAWFQVFQVLIVRGTALTSCSRDVAFAWQRATASLAQEAQEGLAPNVFSYSAAMKVSSLWRKVLGFLPRRASGVPRWRDPDRVVAMNLVADTCVKGQPFQWPLVMQLLDRDLQAAGLEPDLFSADHLIEALPQWRVALHLVKEELLDEDAQVNLASKVVHENWELALSLLPARGRKKSNLVLLSVMAYRGRWHEVLRRLEGLADEEPSDRESVCNAVCTAFDNGSQWPLALRFLEVGVLRGEDLPLVDFQSFESAFSRFHGAREALANHVKSCERLHENIERQLRDLQTARPKEKLLAAEQLYAEVKAQREQFATADAEAKEKTKKAEASTAKMKTVNDELRRYDHELHDLRTERRDKEAKAASLRSKANIPGLEDRKRQVQSDIDRNLTEAHELQVVGRRVQQGEDGYLNEGQSREQKISELSSKLNELKRHHQTLSEVSRQASVC
eukprot:g6193.t1